MLCSVLQADLPVVQQVHLTAAAYIRSAARVILRLPARTVCPVVQLVVAMVTIARKIQPALVLAEALALKVRGISIPIIFSIKMYVCICASVCIQKLYRYQYIHLCTYECMNEYVVKNLFI